MIEDSLEYNEDSRFIGKSVEVAVRIGLVGLLVGWSFFIIRAFIDPVLWGVIIAIGCYPLHQKLAAVMGNREKLAAALLTIFALAVLLVPTVLLTESSIRGIQTLKGKIENGTLTLPPPSDKVAGWPVIGKPIDKAWRRASQNMGETIHNLTPFIKKYGKKLLSGLMGVGLTILQFFISIIISGVLLVNAGVGGKAAQAVLSRVAGKQGETLANLAGATIRSVVQGVLGIAVIQAVLAGAGLVAAAVPVAGLWALMVMVLAIVQLPTILVLGPIIVYVFSIHETTPAVIFMLWSILVSVSDTFLKPLLLGRGVEVPMLVILLGAIGGMMMSGIIGLFIGPVVLSISYKIFCSWIQNNPGQLQKPEPVTPEPKNPTPET